MTSPVVLEVPVRDIRMPGRVVIPDDRISSVTAASAGRLTSQRVSTVGQTVRRGEVLATLWSPELVTAQQELLDILRSDQSLLYENASIGAPSGERQRMDAGVNTGSHTVDQRLDVGFTAGFTAGNPIDADAPSASSRMLQAARTKLEFLGMTPAQISRLEQTGEVVREVDLLSPSAGIILQRNVKSQDYVSAGTVMYEIADISRVWMDFEAWEQDVSWLNTGDVVSYTSTAHAGQTFAGRVAWIDPLVNASSRTVRVRMDVDNASGNWKPDMLVRGEVLSEARNGAAVTTVPSTAVLWTGTRSLVYVQVPDEDVPTFESREVLLGDRFGDRWVVLDGLDAGERVVSNGVFTVDAEFQLRDKFSMMNREVVPAAGGALRRASRDEADTDVAATGGERVAASASEARGDGAAHRSLAGAAFRSGFAGVLDAYMEVKDALVASDAQASARAARVLRDRVAGLDEGSLRGEAQMAWLGQREALRRQMIEWLRSDDIEHQRTQLYAVSRSLFETATTFGIEGVVYQQFCPMAFNDTGATWLAREQQIRNPYLPETMLGCGEVLQVLR
ncbi:MAG: efflux RND transporter periplasmic adaptor subunit [Balneolales bacterium]|nr:efflux RND transporter periplasmic adaptor subunit [Balneolales bacterium]